MSEGNTTDFGDTTTGRNDVGSNAISSATRGIWGGGKSPSVQQSIDYVEIASTGNATDFGDMGNPLAAINCVDNSVRGVFTGGSNPGVTEQNHMTYVQIATTGNAKDFGDLIAATRTHMSTSNGHGGLS